MVVINIIHEHPAQIMVVIKLCCSRLGQIYGCYQIMFFTPRTKLIIAATIIIATIIVVMLISCIIVISIRSIDITIGFQALLYIYI